MRGLSFQLTLATILLSPTKGADSHPTTPITEETTSTNETIVRALDPMNATLGDSYDCPRSANGSPAVGMRPLNAKCTVECKDRNNDGFIEDVLYKTQSSSFEDCNGTIGDRRRLAVEALQDCEQTNNATSGVTVKCIDINGDSQIEVVSYESTQGKVYITTSVAFGEPTFGRVFKEYPKN